MKPLSFKYGVGERILTSADEKGEIISLYYDKAGTKYGIRTSAGNTLVVENQLKKIKHRPVEFK